jgi:hypothetical protein
LRVEATQICPSSAEPLLLLRILLLLPPLPLLLLLQACQSSLNTAGLSLIMQTVATGLLVTACIANEDYSAALGDGIQVRLCGTAGAAACVPAVAALF